MVVLVFLSCSNGFYTLPNSTPEPPRMRNSAQSQFEAGRHAGGKREDHHHGTLSHLNDEFMESICSSIILETGIELRHGDGSAFKPCLPTLVGLISRISWTARRWHSSLGFTKKLDEPKAILHTFGEG